MSEAASPVQAKGRWAGIPWLAALALAALALAALAPAAGCGGEGDLEPLHRLANQNAGTTPTLDLIAPSELRANCATWYTNDLCSVDSEAVIAGAVTERRPDVMMLEEVWDQTRCAEPDRPPETHESPYACAAGDDHQVARLVPEGYSWACSTAERDAMACVTFRDAAFVPLDGDGRDAACADRHCSDLRRRIESDCEHEGHMSYLRGRTADGPTTLVVMHLYVDLTEDDDDCRALQLRATRDALAALPDDEAIVIAGDFNLDPDQWEGPDVDALADLVSTLGLERIETGGPTHMILDVTIDLLFSRGWTGAGTASCEVTFLDEDSPDPMIDHALVACQAS